MKPSMEQLAGVIREIYAADPRHAPEAIEDFLARELQELKPEERLAIIDRLEGHLIPGGPADDLIRRLVPLLLGRDIDAAALARTDLVEGLAGALNRVFSTLNELIAVINTSLGGGPAGDETIRRIIGASLGEETAGMSIEEYLGRIRKAFLTAQQSSRDAARTIAGYILAELDPSSLEPPSGGLRIGPLKKAEAFELFVEKFGRVKKWYESERFLLDFLRQFEKNCQKSFT
ncbi:MAG TPA: hypothetical protein VN416_05360 [Desulfomonilia bacterium]|nr:hypothetical protein [Desulfomonilia bacterium]